MTEDVESQQPSVAETEQDATSRATENEVTAANQTMMFEDTPVQTPTDNIEAQTLDPF